MPVAILTALAGAYTAYQRRKEADILRSSALPAAATSTAGTVARTLGTAGGIAAGAAALSGGGSAYRRRRRRRRVLNQMDKDDIAFLKSLGMSSEKAANAIIYGRRGC